MAQETVQESLEKRARRAILERAVFRVENALLLAGSILLAFFLPNPLPNLLPWWGAWTWLLLGLLGVGTVIWSTLKDEKEAAKAVEELFRTEYNTNGLRDKALKEKVKRAEEYHAQINQALENQTDGILKERMQRTTDQIYDWIANMVLLARRVDAYHNDPIIEGDREELKQSLPRLQARLAQETNDATREQLETTLADRQRQQANIVELDNRMKRADLQLDSSLAALGTVYSQLLLVGTKEVDSSRAERLQAEIADEVTSLQDVVDSINEVYDYQTLGPGR